jgi:hypothetical protein
MVEFETNDNIFAFISVATVAQPTKERGWSGHTSYNITSGTAVS